MFKKKKLHINMSITSVPSEWLTVYLEELEKLNNYDICFRHCCKSQKLNLRIRWTLLYSDYFLTSVNILKCIWSNVRIVIIYRKQEIYFSLFRWNAINYS